MSGKELMLNDVFATASEVYFRYFAAGSPSDDLAYVIELGNRRAMPKCWSRSELCENVRNGTFERRDVQDLAISFHTPSPTDIEHRERRWRYIKELVNDPRVLVRAGRGKLIAEHAKSHEASPETVLNCLRMYWQGGCTEDALLTRYAECGKPSQESTKHPGPAPPDTSFVGPPAPPTTKGRSREDGSRPYALIGQERREVGELVRDIFLVKKTVTKRKLYREILRLKYSVVGSNGKAAVPLPKKQRPSSKQISTVLKEETTVRELLEKEAGKAGYANNHAPMTGTVLQHALGAGFVYEIDSTIVDLWLVAKENRNKIIGKATLYLIIDRFTRLIVGFNLTLDKPSWSGAMDAVMSLVEDKEKMCRRYGAVYDAQAWVAHGVVAPILVADRGAEYLGFESDQLVDGVRIAFVNLPAYMSRLKGIVECTFLLTHVSLKDNTAGYEAPDNPFKRHGDSAYEKDACYTLEELAAEFIDIIGLHNLRMHEEMELDPELVLGGVPPIPSEVWKADTRRQSGLHRTFDRKFLRSKLLPHKPAVVRSEGIYVNKCYYTCPEAERDEWFIKAGSARFRVQTSFDRRLADFIYIHESKWGPTPVKAVLNDRSSHSRGRSVGEVYAVDAERRKMRLKAEEHNLMLRAEQDAKSAERGRRAAQLAAQAKAENPGQSRMSNRPQTRQNETSARRSEVVSSQDRELAEAPAQPAVAARPLPTPAPNREESEPGQAKPSKESPPTPAALTREELIRIALGVK